MQFDIICNSHLFVIAYFYSLDYYVSYRKKIYYWGE